MNKYGIDNIKIVMSTAKLAAISVCQAVAKDGFQPKDLAAPLKSGTFQQAVIDNTSMVIEAIKESGDLTILEKGQLLIHANDCVQDVWTEAKLAIKKLQSQVKK